MKYIEKTGLIDSADHENTCWVAIEGAFFLKSDFAIIKLCGYKNKDAFVANKTSPDIKTIQVKMSELASFETVWSEIATKLITEGVFAGGVIKDTDEVVEG